MAALECQLPQPGSLALQIGRWPILLTRDADGQVSAFHNSCRHRAGPLCWEGEPLRGGRLRCRYHGWQYDLQGRLLRAPDFGGPVPEESSRLFPIQIRVWRGLIFICLHEQPSEFEAVSADLEEALGDRAFEDWSPFHERRVPLACNWKTYMENYLEGYHIPYLHPVLNSSVEMKSYAVHTGRTYARHEVTLREDGSMPCDGLWLWIWPHTALNLYGDCMSLERVLPSGPRSMQIHYSYFARGPALESERMRQASLEASMELTLEDQRVCEAVQRSLEAGVYQRGPLSPRHEQGVELFQESVRRSLQLG